MTVVSRHVLSLAAILVVGSVGFAQEKSLRDQIDQHIAKGWTEQKITPAQASDDANFLRRVYLDLIGTIPSYEETKTFLADMTANKRTKLIDRLLDDPRFADQQANIWEHVLISSNSRSDITH